MSEQNAFADLIARVRAGDKKAVSELIACYEPHIRRVVHMRIGAQLRRVLDTSDILQSVHLDLACALREGKYEILTARQLVQLVTAIAKHKVLGQVAHWGRERRRRQNARGGPHDPQPRSASAGRRTRPQLGNR